MGNDITVVKLLRDAPAYDGQVLSVEGQFIATFERAVLAAFPASLAMRPDWPKLELVYPGIEDRCFRVVSPYVGGRWYYHDPAVVTGRFVAHPRPSLVDLSEVVVRRADREHRVAL